MGEPLELVTTRGWGVGWAVAEPPSPYVRFSDMDRENIAIQLDLLIRGEAERG